MGRNNLYSEIADIEFRVDLQPSVFLACTSHEMNPSKSFLRQRSSATSLTESNGDAAKHPQDDWERREEVVWGKTPGGEG